MFNISLKDLDLGVERVIIEYPIDVKLGGLAKYFRRRMNESECHIRKATTKR